MTPQLRFPEFNDEWQVKKLGDIVKFARGGTLSKDELNDTGRYPAIHYGQLFTEYNEIINDVISKTDSNTGKTSEIGDILMPTSDVTPQGLARASVVNENGVMLGGDINVLKPNYFMSSAFLSYMINSQKKKIMRLVSGTTVRHVYASEVSKAVYFFPSKPEQEKIADFLTAVDERIRLGEQKLAKLEQYKRGVMQQIFSQKIRFKDEKGNEYPEWKEKRLGEVGKIITGKTPSTTDKSHWTGEVKFVTPTDMDGQKYQETSTRTVSYTGSLMLPEKSIMYTCIASIGKMSMSVGDTITNQQINSFIPSSKICNEFTYYNLLWLTPRIISTQSNNTLPIINKSEFSKFKVFLPSWEEQQKIATFLTALDDKITAEKSKLTAAREFKKALLQRMFA